MSRGNVSPEAIGSQRREYVGMNRNVAVLAVSLLILGTTATSASAAGKPPEPNTAIPLEIAAKNQWHNAVANYVASRADVLTGMISSGDEGSAVITLPAADDNATIRNAVAAAGIEQLDSDAASALIAAGSLHLEFKSVPNSKAKLSAAQDMITGAVAAREPWASNISQWGADTTDGTLLIGLTDSTLPEGAANALSSRLGVTVKIEHDDMPAPASTRTTDTSPFYGGDALISSTNVTCSSAFSVKNGASTYELTAGHCGGGTWRVTNGSTLGTVASSRYTSGGYDMEIITVSGAFPYVYIGLGTSVLRR